MDGSPTENHWQMWQELDLAGPQTEGQEPVSVGLLIGGHGQVPAGPPTKGTLADVSLGANRGILAGVSLGADEGPMAGKPLV